MLITSLLLAFAQTSGEAPFLAPAQGSSVSQCVVEVSSPQGAPTRTWAGVRSYSATGIVNLRLRIRTPRTDRPQKAYLRVFTPRGHLYQTLVAVPSRGPRDERSVSGGEEQGAPLSSTFQLAATLPVAGTTIMTDGLYGRWKVEPWLDGRTRPCGAAQPFVIAQ